MNDGVDRPKTTEKDIEERMQRAREAKGRKHRLEKRRRKTDTNNLTNKQIGGEG